METSKESAFEILQDAVSGKLSKLETEYPNRATNKVQARDFAISLQTIIEDELLALLTQEENSEEGKIALANQVESVEYVVHTAKPSTPFRVSDSDLEKTATSIKEQIIERRKTLCKLLKCNTNIRIHLAYHEKPTDREQETLGGFLEKYPNYLHATHVTDLSQVKEIKRENGASLTIKFKGDNTLFFNICTNQVDQEEEMTTSCVWGSLTDQSVRKRHDEVMSLKFMKAIGMPVVEELIQPTKADTTGAEQSPKTVVNTEANRAPEQADPKKIEAPQPSA
ncbi:MAG: hypothetical protein OEY79_04840 [Anaplasmataceae bacterium]|nr:hypothetical protein [Anaplasmataceae bacterium]